MSSQNKMIKSSTAIRYNYVGYKANNILQIYFLLIWYVFLLI